MLFSNGRAIVCIIGRTLDSVLRLGGATNLKVGGSMHWKVGVNTVKTLTFEKGGGA